MSAENIFFRASHLSNAKAPPLYRKKVIGLSGPDFIHEDDLTAPSPQAHFRQMIDPFSPNLPSAPASAR